jgi:hypothetical protein
VATDYRVGQVFILDPSRTEENVGDYAPPVGSLVTMVKPYSEEGCFDPNILCCHAWLTADEMVEKYKNGGFVWSDTGRGTHQAATHLNIPELVPIDPYREFQLIPGGLLYMKDKEPHILPADLVSKLYYTRWYEWEESEQQSLYLDDFTTSMISYIKRSYYMFNKYNATVVKGCKFK